MKAASLWNIKGFFWFLYILPDSNKTNKMVFFCPLLFSFVFLESESNSSETGKFTKICLFCVKNLEEWFIYNCKNVIEVNGIKYSFGPVIVLHKGESDVECLSESEICGAVIFLMDSEVTLCYDGREFTAFELF